MHLIWPWWNPKSGDGGIPSCSSWRPSDIDFPIWTRASKICPVCAAKSGWCGNAFDLLLTPVQAGDPQILPLNLDTRVKICLVWTARCGRWNPKAGWWKPKAGRWNPKAGRWNSKAVKLETLRYCPQNIGARLHCPGVGGVV